MKSTILPCLTMVVLAAFAVSASGQDTKKIPKGPHGGTVEAFQEEQLDLLQQQKDESKTAFGGIDPQVLQAFMPDPNNQMTEARVKLGRKLYFDTRLSIDGTESCATCHDVMRGFCDQRPVSEGVDNPKTGERQLGKRNAPTVMNIGLLRTMFWDGRSPSIEHQAMQPIVNPIEMGMPLKEDVILSKIKDDPEYKAMFQEAYGHPINYTDIGNALAVFERTFVFMDAPGLRYLQGDENAISEEAKKGWELFNGKARCMTCHPMSVSQPTGSDNKFHNIGIAAKKQDFDKLALEVEDILAKDSSFEKLEELALNSHYSELGRAIVTGRKADLGAFRTPILLNVGITWPYMHDGSLATLWDVVDHYNKGGEPNLYLDGGIEPLNLTDEEVDQLVAFLFTLTDVRFQAQNQATFDRMKAQSLERRMNKDDAVAKRSVLQYERRIDPAKQKKRRR